MKLLSFLDLTNNELRNVRLQNLAGDPAGVEGRIYYNTTDDKVRVYANGVWGDLAGSMSAGEILAQLVTVDGIGSGLDADLLDGVNGASYLDRANHTGAQPIATVTGLQAALDAKVDDSQVGAASGVASLDAGGKVPSAQLPALALTDVSVVADIAARDALTVQEGDVAIVTGTNQTFIYDGAAWQEMTSPTDGVSAVTGAAPITSTGGTTPEIGLAAGGIQSGHIGDGQVTDAKLASVFTKKFAALIGDGAATAIAVTHNLGTRDVTVEVYDAATFDTVYVDVVRTSVNVVTLTFSAAPAADAYRAVIVG